MARTLKAKSNSDHREDSETYVSMCLNAHGGGGRLDAESETLIAQTITADMYRSGGAVAGNNDQGVRNCFVVPLAFSCKDHGADAGDTAPTLRAMGHSDSHANAGGQLAVTVSLRGRDGGATAELGDDVGNALRGSQGGGDKAHVLAFRASGQERFQPSDVYPPIAHTDGGGAGVPTLAIGGRARGDDGRGYSREEHISEIVGTLDSVKPDRVLGPQMAVRRLTPTECERLQGFPDGYTQIPYRGKLAADGPRYKALGNSWAVPCARWIFERMDRVDKMLKEKR